MSDRQRLGHRGEDAAASWYSQAGYVVLDRNWRCPRGELDLICARGDLVVFCEVKTRSSNRYGSGAEAVTAAKQARVRRLATVWLSESADYWRRIRFDVADVDGRGHLRIVEDCF